MTLEQQKIYLAQFVAQGIPLDKCYTLVYMNEEEIYELKQDKEFIDEMNSMLLTLTLDKMQSYNSKVDNSVAPSDELKRLQVIAPEIFKETQSIAVSGDLIINKVKDE